MLRLKYGVSLKGIQPAITFALVATVELFRRYGANCTVTSANDGVHMEGSKHYKGLALDFRTRELPKSCRSPLTAALRSALGREYDVVLEKDHLHVEYDPK